MEDGWARGSFIKTRKRVTPRRLHVRVEFPSNGDGERGEGGAKREAFARLLFHRDDNNNNNNYDHTRES